ncbi:acyl-CoA dehydrogenase domain protein [Shewanella halifaxensis HAW-EB4]|uniref:Acyl-CoA dehydrogenase domain protein n=1 Tax=Shewanella halifaxensis (strain HAW-EB4) TaxID=458817 RepID=B0TTX2_SHEHH|nr:acyl-CoA dehydrogenase family protein [Shewanella halifaxensis]ABZ76690.1 acyl-CoA dehydrogenase domain protein [Shewanella halifaxensis HAW-EB4]
MDFTFTEDELAFREAISRFLMTEAAPEALREIWETDTGRSPELRNKIAEQGLTALSIPEESGGLGLGDVAWSLMTQELGYYGIPDSLADTAYLAAGVLSALPQTDNAERNEQIKQWLVAIGEGSIRVAVGHPVNPLVADAAVADLLILLDGDDVHAVTRKDIDVVLRPSIDSSRRLAKVSWQPSSDSLLATGEVGKAIQQQILNRGALSAAGQLLGLAQRMLDLSIDYVAQRKQFGRVIGSFQAVKHHLADVASKIEMAKPVLYRAAKEFEQGCCDSSVYISQAKVFCAEAAHLAARNGIQVHGAMGYTWEVDLQMFMKRTWVLESTWGDVSFHKARVNEFVFDQNCKIGPGQTFGRT